MKAPQTRDIENPPPHIIALAIHGGAGGTTTPSTPPPLLAAYRRRLSHILTSTHCSSHTSSMDAVCDAVTQLEDPPLFNAAKGAVFDLSGQTVCEASLMTTQPGFHSSSVAVTGIRQTKNPILLTKVLFEKNEEVGGHGFYSGLSAEKAGWERGTKRVSKDYYYTKRRWIEHKKGIETKTFPSTDYEEVESEEVLPEYTPDNDKKQKEEDPHPDQEIFDRYAYHLDFLPQGTVGAVALDSNGHLSVATSTGGKANKYPGRIGDTPSVGSGFWASNFTSSPSSSSFSRRLLQLFSRKEEEKLGIAISGTGDGDFFLRTCFASSLTHRIQFGGKRFEKAIKDQMQELVALYGRDKGVGGAIILDKKGKAYFPLAASTMNRGLISKHTGYKTKVAIFDHEELA